MKKFLALLLAALMVAAMFAGCSGKKDYTKDNTEYVIGVSGPLTGDAAVYGVAVKNAAQMAVDEINAAGGLNGIKFKLIAENDEHDASKVPARYASLFEAGMQLSLGTVTTGPGEEFKTLAKDDNVFFLTPSASGDEIPEFDNGYQMCFADSNQGKVAAKYVSENYAGKTIGLFYKSDDPYSKGIYDQFKANLDKSITVVETSFTDTSATDFRTQIDSLKNCELIFMPIYYTPANQFMNQAKGIVKNSAVYYGCDGFDGIDSNFDISGIPQQIIMLSHFNSKSTEGKAGEFIKKYTEKYGKDTLNQFGASAYDCVYALYGAMKKAIEAGTEIPVTISASEMCEILQGQFTGGYTYENGVTGDKISWDKDGYVSKSAVQYVIKEAN